MRRTVRSVAAVALAAAVLPLAGAGPAYADTSTEPATNGAYFNRAGVDKPDPLPFPPPNPANVVDGVAAEHLAVAVRTPGEADKISFLGFDLVSVGFDATITKAVVTVPLAENGNGNMQMSPDPAKVQACPADATGFAGEDGASIANGPKALCDVFKVTATATPDMKAYVFDITTMAQSWLSEANNGMALVPTVTSSPFQVVFLPFANAKLDVEFSPASTETVVETFPVTETPLTTDTGTDAGTGTDSFSSGSGSTDTGGSVDSGASSGGFGTAETPVVAGDSGAGTPAAAPVAAGQAPTVAATPVATQRVGRVSESLSPTPAFFLAGLLLAAVLALLSLIMGDPKAPVVRTQDSRLSRALKARQRVGGPTLGG